MKVGTRDLRWQHARRHRVRRARSPYLVAVRPEVVRGRARWRRPRPRSVAVDGRRRRRAPDAKVIDRHVEEREGPKLDEATIVVSGGRGLGEAEKYEPLVEELAKLLGGASGRVPRDRRRRLGAVLEPGRSDRQDGEADGVHRARHLGRHPAHGRHEGLEEHHRRQQGRRGARSSRSPTSASSATCNKVVPKLIEALKARS